MQYYQLYTGIYQENVTEYICTIDTAHNAIERLLKDNCYYNDVVKVLSICHNIETHWIRLTVEYVDLYDDREQTDFILKNVIMV